VQNDLFPAPAGPLLDELLSSCQCGSCGQPGNVLLAMRKWLVMSSCSVLLNDCSSWDYAFLLIGTCRSQNPRRANMNVISHPPIRAHRVLSVVVTGAVSAALTLGAMLPFTTTASAAPRPLTNTSAPLCALLAGAAPGSAAAFRIAETIADLGQSCDPDPPLCALLAGATPGSPAKFLIAETIADLGQNC
jgi:hypothetical protein